MSDDATTLSVILNNEKQGTVKAPDGKEYIIKPLDLYTLGEAEEKFGKIMAKWDEEVLGSMRNVYYLLWLSFKEQNTQLTPKDVGKWFDTTQEKELEQILGVLLKRSGLAEKNQKGATPAPTSRPQTTS